MVTKMADFFCTTKGVTPNSNLIKSYLIHSEANISKLPTKTTRGTMEPDSYENDCCEYGSTCICAMGNEETAVYMLATDNQWKKF